MAARSGMQIDYSNDLLTDRFHHDHVAARCANNAHFKRFAIVDEIVPVLLTLYNLDDLRVAWLVETDDLAFGCLQRKSRRSRCHGALGHLVSGLRFGSGRSLTR